MPTNLGREVLSLDPPPISINLIDLEGRELMGLPSQTPVDSFAVKIGSHQVERAGLATLVIVLVRCHVLCRRDSPVRLVHHLRCHPRLAVFW